tara:strand:- start:1607 stop:1948 length:342 start_codon:yes stop_codon:yes gene_type:complete
METEEDMASYLDINYGHGVQAIYTNSSGSASSISIILNNEYIEQEGLEVSVEATQPIAYCRSIDVPSIAHGNSLQVSAIKDVEGNILSPAANYTVVNIQSDRTGFSALQLEKI